MDCRTGRLSSWPDLHDSWWVPVLAVTGLAVFVTGLLTRVRCELALCSGTGREALLDLDSVGGVPRTFTAGLFAATAVAAVLAACRSGRRVASWWMVLAAGAVLLAVVKATSAYSLLDRSGGVTAPLVLGLAASCVLLVAFDGAGRARDVPGARPAVVALACYAAAALGLDAVTAVVFSAQETVGAFTRAGTVFVEEFGEAMAALLVLVVIRWQVPHRARRGRVAADAPCVARDR